MVMQKTGGLWNGKIRMNNLYEKKGHKSDQDEEFCLFVHLGCRLLIGI